MDASRPLSLPRLVVFEGVDGSGKTTLAGALARPQSAYLPRGPRLGPDTIAPELAARVSGHYREVIAAGLRAGVAGYELDNSGDSDRSWMALLDPLRLPYRSL